MQKLQRFQERRDRVDTRNAEPLQEGIRRGIGARKRSGVRDGGGARLFGAADLHRDDRLLQLPRPCRQPLEAVDLVETFNVQAKAGNALVLDETERHFGKAGLCLVACRHQKRHGQTARLHGQVAGDVGGLGDDGRALLAVLQPATAMLVRPQQGAVGIVDQPIAVLADDRHATRGLDQRQLQVLAFGLVMRGLAEAGRKTDGATGTARTQRAHHIDGEMPVDTDEGGVRRMWQIGKGAVGLDPRHLVLAWMDRPDIAGKAHLERLPDDIGGKETTTDDGDGFRAQQA